MIYLSIKLQLFDININLVDFISQILSIVCNSQLSIQIIVIQTNSLQLNEKQNINRMNQSPAELHHKMCKKVAQLTKVIFYLNTKNDQYQSNLKSVVNAYQSELDTTIKEANIIIQKYKQAAQKANKNQQLENQLRKIQDNVQRQREKSFQQFQKYKKAMEDKQSKTSTEANRKLRQYETQVEGMRGRVEALARTLDQVTSKLQSQRKNHQKTMNDYVKQQNQKYNALLKKKIQIQQELNVKKGKVTDLQKLISELRKQLEDQIRKQKLSSQALVQELKKKSQQKIAQLEEKLKKAERSIVALQEQIANLRNQLKQKNSQISQLNKKIAQLEDESRQNKIMLDNSRLQINNLSKQCGDLKETNRLLGKQKQQLENMIKALQDKLNFLGRESNLKNGEFQSMRQQYERQLAEKNTEIRMLKDKNMQAQKKIDMLGLQLAGLKDANDKNNLQKLRQIEKLKQTIDQLNSRLDSLKNNSTDQMKQLQRILKQKTAKFQNQMKELISKYQDQIKKIHEQHQRDIEQLKNQHKKQIQNLRNQFESEKKDLSKSYQAKIKDLEQKLAAEIRKMQDSNGYLKKMYEQKINNYEAKIKQLNGTVNDLKVHIENLNKKIQSLEDELERVRKEKINSNQLIAKLQAELQQLRNQRKKLQGNLGQQIQLLRKKLTEQQFSYEQRIRLMKKDHSDQLDVQKRLLNQRFEDQKRKMEIRHQSKIQELEAKFKQQLKELQERLRGMSNRSELSNAQWQQKLRKKQQEYQLLLKQANRKHIQQLKQLESKQQKKIAQLNKEFEDKLKDKISQLQRKKQKQLQELDKKKQVQKRAIIQEYQGKLSKLSKNFDMQIQNLKTSYESKIKQLQNQLEKEKGNHNLTKGKYQDLQKSFGILGSDLDAERASHNNTKSTLTDREDQIRDLHRKIEKIEKQHSDEVTRLKTQYQYREEELKRQNEKKVQGLVNEQIQWTQQIKKEFTNMIEQNKNRIKLMEQEYSELKGLFDDRPSREQDLRLIQKLQALLEQSQDQLKKAKNQLKFFKLELINRQNNFNKLFNANPNVGILNPLQATTKTQKQSTLPNVNASTKKSIK